MVSAGMELVVIEEHARTEGLGLSISRDRWWSVEGLHDGGVDTIESVLNSLSKGDLSDVGDKGASIRFVSLQRKSRS